MKKIENITVNKYLGLYERADGSRMCGVKNIHHKINLRSWFEVPNIAPYYWFVHEFVLEDECDQQYFPNRSKLYDDKSMKSFKFTFLIQYSKTRR